MGLNINDQTTLHSLLFADDQIAFAWYEEEMENLMRRVVPSLNFNKFK